MESLNEYVDAGNIVSWAKASLKIIKHNDEMTDEDIRRIIRWIGKCSFDTIYVDGDKPILRRIGIAMMLTVTLLEFPDFYSRYGLAQFN